DPLVDAGHETLAVVRRLLFAFVGLVGVSLFALFLVWIIGMIGWGLVALPRFFSREHEWALLFDAYSLYAFAIAATFAIVYVCFSVVKEWPRLKVQAWLNHHNRMKAKPGKGK